MTRNFRDMSLTEEEALELAQAYWPRATWEGDAWVRFEQRCMSLLPLWRQWGLKRLKAEGHSEGYAYGVKDTRSGRFE